MRPNYSYTHSPIQVFNQQTKSTTWYVNCIGLLFNSYTGDQSLVNIFGSLVSLSINLVWCKNSSSQSGVLKLKVYLGLLDRTYLLMNFHQLESFGTASSSETDACRSLYLSLAHIATKQASHRGSVGRITRSRTSFMCIDRKPNLTEYILSRPRDLQHRIYLFIATDSVRMHFQTSNYNQCVSLDRNA